MELVTDNVNASERVIRRPTRRYPTRHGLRALKGRVLVRGLRDIDMRTSAARALSSWRRQLLADLGGEEHVSAAQAALVEMATRTRLLIDSADAWLLAQDSIVLKRRGTLLPAVRERQSLVDSLGRLLSALGLERKARPGPDLEAYIAQKYDAGSMKGQGREETCEPEPVCATG